MRKDRKKHISLSQRVQKVYISVCDPNNRVLTWWFEAMDFAATKTTSALDFFVFMATPDLSFRILQCTAEINYIVVGTWYHHRMINFQNCEVCSM